MIPDIKATIDHLVTQVSQVILGKEIPIRLALTALIARGHVLIEDVPGVGKTTLAHVLARVLGLSFQRIQFTSDLLPADIIGVSVYDKEVGQFKFHLGPIFAQMVLADEINRATPKTQSALLEAMEEHQVTAEGETRPLPTPFFVLATQNPLYQIGTFPLPESQLDRFMMRLELGYPNHQTERALLKGRDRREMIAEMEALMTVPDILAIQQAISQVHIAEALIDYLQAILEFTRQSPRYQMGLSPRAGLAILHCAQAWALIHGRDYVVPEDVQMILPGVVGHRLVAITKPGNTHTLVKQLIEEVAIP
ncbi:methanol dehydrogenase regulatory protein MoxR [Thioploca ingrica]|uniref:Methanol dehydrogenase regulatory protein MoxR n=1 Tax=Thioploca ingrica TaxID=40754 RepID=A0A090BVG7_9GAMM|nr:methanol dehydrogenase regulatory protein MoxR [Thioploca ingrica]